MRFEKRKSLAKGGFELWLIASKMTTARALPSTSLELLLNDRLLFNHTLVGGVSQNSLCQQGSFLHLV